MDPWRNKMNKIFFYRLAISLTLWVIGLVFFISGSAFSKSNIQNDVTVKKNHPTNITDAVFVMRNGLCHNYVGSYSSEVEDLQREKAFGGEITITVDEHFCFINANNIPNHNFNDNSARFATPVQIQDFTYRITRTPHKAVTPTPVDMRVTNAVMLNGVEVDLYSAGCYGVGNGPLGREKIGCNDVNNPWRYDPMAKVNHFGTDKHHAHVQPNGAYHYHGNPMAMFISNCDTQTQPSAVIGFAADGFPIFGSCIVDKTTAKIRKVTSSFVLKNNGGKRKDVPPYQTPKAGNGFVMSDNYNGQFIGDYEYQLGAGDLDECNGMTVKGQYGYYVTDSFPWILNCYQGTVDASFRKKGPRLKNRMHGH